MTMNFLTCCLINGPFFLFNIVANAFFIFCMICPLHGERIKQPLKLLLASLICCTVIYLTSAILLSFIRHRDDNLYFTLALYVVFFCSLSTSMSSSVWLNFFYDTQIVPAQRAIFIWVKKNIKSIIFCIWLTEGINSLFYGGVMVLKYLALTNSFGFGYNATMYDTNYLQTPLTVLPPSIFAIAVCLARANLIFSVCVMVMSSGSTVVYLSRHMRRMVANGQPISGPRFSGQVRVTVTGVLQGVLYVLCAVWTMYCFFAQFFMSLFHDLYIQFTLINLYMSGTTFNLGAGQAVFRQRAADIWLRAARFCKATQVE